MSEEHRQPTSIEPVAGTVAEVTCPCGRAVRLCLGQGASAWVCQGCKLTLALPDWSSREAVCPCGWRFENVGALLDSVNLLAPSKEEKS
jgi:hypothetical protein